MSYTGLGRLFGVGIVVVAGAYTYLERQFNNDAVEGTVYNIKRTCNYDTYYENDEGKRTSIGQKTNPCTSTTEFRKIASDYQHRVKDIKGNVVVTVRYATPENNGYYLADLKFDGGDDEFYTLHEDDKIKILVNKSDPTKIRKY